ncbi:hypothetical protein CAL7102_09272 [Dulcicalothrix desertica PCC 7102]|nr:hypothetical protein CAL7102_09272 [Dulcicalothrix desertica PCC 7102]
MIYTITLAFSMRFPFMCVSAAFALFKFDAQPGTWSVAESILVNSQTGLLNGASDRRRPEGGAYGY